MRRDVTFEPVVDDAAVAAVRSATDADVNSIVEYTLDEFRVAYVAEETRALYDGDAAMYDHFDRVHEFVNLDVTEIELFTEELFSFADEARYITTALDAGKMVRVCIGERRGAFLGLAPDARVDPVVEALFDAVDR